MNEAVPRIGRGFRLQWEPAQDAHVLLYPEGVVKLNASAGHILALCDGERSVAQIVSELERRFGQAGLSADVNAFLDLADKQRWVRFA